MELSFWAASDVGRKRKHNEDNFLIDGFALPRQRLLVLRKDAIQADL